MEPDGREGQRGAPSAEKIARELKWHGLGQVAGEIAWYGMVLVLAALLDPRDFGIVAIGMVIVRVAALLTHSGTGGSIIAAKELTRAEVFAALRTNLAIGVGLTLAVALAAGVLTDAFVDGGDADVVRALSVIVLLASLASVPEALLKKSLDFKRYSLVTGGAALLTAACAITAALLGAGVWSLVVRQVLYQALVAAFAWTAARGALAGLPGGASGGKVRRPEGRLAFLLIAASSLAAMTIDNLVVGAITDATQLGLYALAFTLGFAPLTQISWRIGQVLFPAAAATSELAAVGRRTVRVARTTALLLFPLAPVAVALAPALLPGLFGDDWEGMVGPFQLLVTVGVLHAVLNTIGESLSGTGNAGFRAWSDTSWAVGTLVLVAVMTDQDGIDGAALAHLIAFAPLGAAYVFLGSRRIGTGAGELWRGMRAVVVPVAVQAAVTLAMLALLDDSSDLVAGVVAAATGGIALAVLLLAAPSRPLGEVRHTVGLLLSRGA